MQFFAALRCKAYYSFVTPQGERIMPLLPCYTYLRNITMRFLMHKVILVQSSFFALEITLGHAISTSEESFEKKNYEPYRELFVITISILKAALPKHSIQRGGVDNFMLILPLWPHR